MSLDNAAWQLDELGFDISMLHETAEEVHGDLYYLKNHWEDIDDGRRKELVGDAMRDLEELL